MKRSFTLQKAFTGSISIIDGQGEFSQGFWMPNDDGIEFSRKMKKVKNMDKIRVMFV